MSKKACFNCMFFASDGLADGKCHFNAPSPVVFPAGDTKPDSVNFEFLSWRPTVSRDDWCGSFKEVEQVSDSSETTKDLLKELQAHCNTKSLEAVKRSKKCFVLGNLKAAKKWSDFSKALSEVIKEDDTVPPC